MSRCGVLDCRSDNCCGKENIKRFCFIEPFPPLLSKPDPDETIHVVRDGRGNTIGEWDDRATAMAALRAARVHAMDNGMDIEYHYIEELLGKD